MSTAPSGVPAPRWPERALAMDADEYRKMAKVEDAMWWYRGLHANLMTKAAASLLEPAHAPLRVLDAGCGTGGLLRRMAAALPGAALVGMDFDEGACRFAVGKSGRPILRGSIDRLPFADGSFDLIVSADVLCHAGVAEERAFAELHRCLAPGGALLLNLPAYQWMYSSHDARVHTARRYTRPGLLAKLAAHGFGRAQATYWNTLLFPLMVLRRKLLKPQDEGSDVMPYPAPIERIFGWLMDLENLVLSRGLALPFGGSVLVRAVKQ